MQISKTLRLGIETLEARDLMASNLTATLTGGLLRIEGTEQADRIVVHVENNQILIDKAAKNGTQAASFPVKDVSRLDILGLGSDDQISVFGAFGGIGVTIDGGAGRDTVITSLGRSVVLADTADFVVAGNMALIQRQLESQSLALGAPLTNETAHRDSTKGVVQQFQFGDIRLNGSSGEVYIAAEQGVRTISISGTNVSIGSKKALDYHESSFMNYRADYRLRPTLLVITHGLDGEINSRARGYSWKSGKLLDTSSAAWTTMLGANMARELNAAGSMVHVMFVDWASQSPNTSATEQVANHIKRFLQERKDVWDVSLIGHSRGGVFNSQVGDLLRGHEMDQTQLIMLDPTAAVSMNDQYPTRKPNAVDNAVAYDDGLVLYPLGGTREGQAISGADYRRVTVPGVGRFQSTPSHMRMPSYYSDYNDPRDSGPGNPDLTFHRDLDWLIAHKTVSNSSAFKYEARAGFELVIASPPADGWNYIFDVGFDPNRNGDATGYISVLGIGSASFTVGKSGLNVGYGMTVYGSAAASISDQGMVVGINGPGYSPINLGGQVIIGPAETRLDIDMGPLRVSLFGKDAGLFYGGQKVSFDRFASIRTSGLTMQHIDVAKLLQKAFGATTADLAKALKGIGANMGQMATLLGADMSILESGMRKTWTKSGQYILQTLDSAGKVVKEWIYYDDAGKKLYQWRAWADGKLTDFEQYTSTGWKEINKFISTSGKWVSQTLDSAGKVVKEWIYYDDAGTKLYQWRAWTAGKLTDFEQYTSTGWKEINKFISTSGKWVSQTLDSAGKVLKEWIYYDDAGTKLYQWRAWTAGKLTDFEQFTSTGWKEINKFISTSGKWVSQTLDSAGKVVKEWIYYDAAGTKLQQYGAWAGNKLTDLSRYASDGVTRTFWAYVSTTGNWVERTYTNGVETAVKIWNSSGKYLGDQMKNFSDAVSKLDPTTKSWWPL